MIACVARDQAAVRHPEHNEVAAACTGRRRRCLATPPLAVPQDTGGVLHRRADRAANWS